MLSKVLRSFSALPKRVFYINRSTIIISRFQSANSSNDSATKAVTTTLTNAPQNVETLKTETIEAPQKPFVFFGDKRVDEPLGRAIQKLYELMAIYEEMIGIKELKAIQRSVIEAENRFVEAQEARRSLNAKLMNVQVKLKELRDQMDRLNRTDASYLKLFTQEHECLNSEKLLLSEYNLKEGEERDFFFRLSNLLRESQEQERARAERIKYLQLMMSIACTFLGICSAFLISFFRKSEIKSILNHEKASLINLEDKLENFTKDQMQLIDKLSILIGNEKDNRVENLSHLISKTISEHLNKVPMDKQLDIKEVRTENKTMNDLKAETTLIYHKMQQQQQLLKIVSVASIISTLAVCVITLRN